MFAYIFCIFYNKTRKCRCSHTFFVALQLSQPWCPRHSYTLACSSLPLPALASGDHIHTHSHTRVCPNSVMHDKYKQQSDHMSV